MQLKVEQLECTVGNNRLLRNLSFEVREQQCLLLTGQNGSGKTTLLRALAGLLWPTAGSIRWRDIRSSDVYSSEQSEANDTRWLPVTGNANWPLRMLYHGHALGWKAELTVAENLQLQLRLDGLIVSQQQQDAAIDAVGLAPRRHLGFGLLSAGQRRRLTLARISLDQRPLWLLDEPTTALDDAGQQLLAAIIDRHLQQNGSAIVATHPRLPLRGPVSELNLSAVASALAIGE